MPEPGAGSGGARGGSGMGAGDPGGYGAGVGDVDPIGYGVSAGRGSGHWVSMGKSGPEWVSTPSLVETYLEDYTLPKAAPVKAAPVKSPPRRPPPRSLPAPIEYEAKKHAPRPAPPPPVSRPDPKPAGRPVVTGTSVAPSAKVALKFTDKAKEASEKLAVRSGAAGSDMQKYGKFSPVMSTLLDMIEQDIPLQDPKYVSDSPKWRPMFPLGRPVVTGTYAKNMPNFYANLPPETVEQLFHSQMPVIQNSPKKDIDYYDQVENNIFQKASSTINYTPQMFEEDAEDMFFYPSSDLGGPGTQSQASLPAKMAMASKPTVNLQYGNQSYLPANKHTAAVENYLNPRLELEALEADARANEGFFKQWNPYTGYSKTGNVYNRSILEANMLADKFAAMYGLPKNKQEASTNYYEMSTGVPEQTLPPHANRYTMYDLARHGFLATQVGLLPAQFTESSRSSGQPSDYMNNMAANKFMRPGGTMLKNLDSLVGTSQIENKDQKMNDYMKTIYQEMVNPGSTGYKFDWNIYD